MGFVNQSASSEVAAHVYSAVWKTWMRTKSVWDRTGSSRVHGLRFIAVAMHRAPDEKKVHTLELSETGEGGMNTEEMNAVTLE